MLRQTLYVSRSLIGDDARTLDDVMVRSRTNNSVEGVTGLLWTDGGHFAQVIEGGHDAVEALLSRLRKDLRHTEVTIVQDALVPEREFGEWHMARPSSDALAGFYEERMLTHMERLDSKLARIFAKIVEGSNPPAGH